MSAGLFITIEGGEGLGKSTLIQSLRDALPGLGIDPTDTVFTREPGGTRFCEAVRAVMLADHGEYIPPLSEALLMTAARAQHVENLIRPALEQGKLVICDRYMATTLAYQGNGREMDREFLLRLQKGFPVPTLTLLLDADPEVGFARMPARGQADRMEKAGIEFFRRVREGFMEGSTDRRLSDRTQVINANQSQEAMLADVIPHVTRLINVRNEILLRNSVQRDRAGASLNI